MRSVSKVQGFCNDTGVPNTFMLQHLLCPISCSLPVDPVVACDGQIYERECIERHFKTRGTSPVTNGRIRKQLTEVIFVTNVLTELVDQGVKDPLLEEWKKAFDHSNRTTMDDECVVTVYKKGKIVQQEFPDGVITFLKDETIVRKEFYDAHPSHGEIYYFEGGEHVRTEYASIHPDHGMVDYFKNADHVRTEYSSTHRFHGEICFFEGENMTCVYPPTHARHGTIDHYENGTFVRSEFCAFHSDHGMIAYFEGDRHVRTEYSSFHARHGEIRYFERGRHVRTEFSSAHPRCGDVCHIEMHGEAKRSHKRNRDIFDEYGTGGF